MKAPRLVVYLNPSIIRVYFVKYAPFRKQIAMTLPLYSEEGLNNLDGSFRIMKNSATDLVIQAHYDNVLFVLLEHTNKRGKTDLRVLVWDLYVPAHNSYIMTIVIDEEITDKNHLWMKLKEVNEEG